VLRIYRYIKQTLGIRFLQFAKVGNALTGPLIESSTSVAPLSFKTLVGRGHQEFSTSRQQVNCEVHPLLMQCFIRHFTTKKFLHIISSLKDAQEYFSYLVEAAARAEHGAQHRKFVPMTKLFELGLETRIECSISHRVSACLEYFFKIKLLTLLCFPGVLLKGTNRGSQFGDSSRSCLE